MVERYTRISPDVISYEATIEDPNVFTRPWKMSMPLYRRQEKDVQLDNLLLTQGWRRFVWKDILSNTFPPPAYQAETGIGISGRVLSAGGKPAAGAKVFLLFNIDLDSSISCVFEDSTVSGILLILALLLGIIFKFLIFPILVHQFNQLE